MIPFDFQPKFGRDSEEGFRLPLRFVWDPSGEVAGREREWRNTPRLAPPGEALSSPGGFLYVKSRCGLGKARHLVDLKWGAEKGQ